MGGSETILHEDGFFNFLKITDDPLIRSFSRTDFYQYDSHIKISDNSNLELDMSAN